MVKALIDTNVLIDFLNGAPQARRELDLYEDAAISIVSWMEVMAGGSEADSPPLRAFLAHFEVVDLDQHVAERAVTLRRAHRVKLPDAIIWASAQSQGRLLVTRDVKDFPPDDPGVRVPYVLA